MSNMNIAHEPFLLTETLDTASERERGGEEETVFVPDSRRENMRSKNMIIGASSFTLYLILIMSET